VPARAHGTFQVAVGGGQHSHVHPKRLSAPDAFEFPLLEHSQQGGLRLHRKLANLVQKDRSAVTAEQADADSLSDAPLRGAGTNRFDAPCHFMPTVLQLDQVTLVDVDVVPLLNRCETEGVRLANCSTTDTVSFAAEEILSIVRILPSPESAWMVDTRK
jgi:hypothetical protein